jgi:hypothetical protein
VSQYKEGILVSEYPVRARIGLEDVKSEYADRMTICQEPHCVLIKLHGVSLITDEAVEFVVSPENTEMTKAVAFVVDVESGYYEHGNNILWMIKNIDKPKFNIELFNNEDSAVEWLSNYCK